MKPFPKVLVLALLLAGAACPLLAKDVVVIDFALMPRNSDGSRQRAYEYGFGDWSDAGRKVVQIMDKGLLVNHAGSKGGVGANSDPDFGSNTHARIDLVIGNQNQADSYSFALVDRDGTDHSWSIPLKGQPVGQPIGVLLDLTQGKEDKPGKKPGLDLKKVRTWQIKGNFQDKPVEILVLKITAVSG